jgi:MFS family permease
LRLVHSGYSLPITNQGIAIVDPAGVNTGIDTYRAQTKRYVHLLFALQAIGASSPAIIISLGGLVSETLSSNKALSTLPVSLFNIGLALSVLPVGALIARFGRVNAYTLGALSAFIGGIIAAWGVINGSFILFCLGCLMAGVTRRAYKATVLR